jgi:hypothetical protein
MTITNLYAYTPDQSGSTGTATITVEDNGSPTTPVLSCTVTFPNGASGSSCTSGASAPINAGDFLTVVVSAASNYVAVAWRVSFSVH